MQLDITDKGGRQDWRQLWPAAGLLFVSAVLFAGYRVYFHNQALQLPLVHLINDRSLYPNDPFAATLPYYASVLWWLVAWGRELSRLSRFYSCCFFLRSFC